MFSPGRAEILTIPRTINPIFTKSARWVTLRCRLFYVCKSRTYARFSPERVNRFEGNFEGIFSSLPAFVRDMYEFSLNVPCRNIFLMEHIWRDREILVTGSEVSTGSQKCPHAVKKDELYVPSKFHPNRITCLGGDRFTHIKKTGSKFSDILPARDQDRFCRNHHKHRFDHLQHNLGYQFLGGPIFLCKLDS